MNKHDSPVVPENVQPLNAIDSANEQERKAARVIEQIAETVREFQIQSTGHTPTAVSVVLSEDTLVITVHGALTPAERALAKTAEGAAKVQEFHRQLFATSFESLRQEIKRITGREVQEATAEVEPATGAIVQAFTTGTMVQVFLLKSADREPDASGSKPDRN
jgi:uncharacterized protein YbcI